MAQSVLERDHRLAVLCAKVAVDELRRALPLVSCYCHHCQTHFRRYGIITFLCGRCEDEGHIGEPRGCLACEDTLLWSGNASRAVHVSYGPVPGHPNWKGGLL